MDISAYMAKRPTKFSSMPYLESRIWVRRLCETTGELSRRLDAAGQPEESNGQLLALVVHA